MRHPSYYALLSVPLSIAVACTPMTTTPDGDPEPETVPEPDTNVNTEPPMPAVEGLVALEDESPEVGVVEYTIDIGTHSARLLPGTSPTEVFAYNGMLPGPLLQARVGETVRIVATNNLSEPTTIHWHGLRIDYRMDGVVHGDLPMIAPGETFVYEFTPPEAGTFWYHPHMRTTVQVERGLYGMLIVHEDEDVRPDVDADRAFVFDDIRLNDDGSIAPFATNGMDVVHGRSGNVLLVNGDADPVTLTLSPGQVERWRLVNTANAREMLFRFSGLEVREIGADAGLWPQSETRFVDEVPLAVGARAELEVRLAPGVSSAALDSMVITQNPQGQLVLSPFTMVSVAVGDAVVETARLGHTAELPVEPLTARLDVDEEFELQAFNIGGQVVTMINDVAYEDSTPWKVNQGEFKVMKIINRMPMSGHPFHLHGQFFKVVERDGQPADEPGWRDTVMLPAGNGRSVTIASWFDNPGTWMYHCHILEHADAGMMAVVEVAPSEAE